MKRTYSPPLAEEFEVRVERGFAESVVWYDEEPGSDQVEWKYEADDTWE